MRFSRVPASLAHYSRQVSLLDVTLGAIAPLLALTLRDVTYFTRADAVEVSLYVVVATLATAASAMYFRIGQAAPRFLSRHDVAQALKTAACASIITAAVAFIIARLDGAPRSLPGLHFLVLGALLLGSRVMLQDSLRKREALKLQRPSSYGENVILVGANDLASLYIRMVDCVVGARPRIVALLDDDARLHGQSICGRIVAGDVNMAPDIVAEYAVHGVVIDRILIAHLDPLTRRRAMSALRPYCEANEMAIEFLISRLGLEADPARQSLGAVMADSAARDQNARAALVGEQSAHGQRNQRWASRSRYWRARRAVDLVGAGVALLVFAPAFAIVALVVLLDVGGPVVFWQERVGFRGRRISVHKFRTLRNPVDSEGRVLADEERLSPIGRFLRGSRLDELPQLYDILRGEMTIIGPRPLLPVDLAEGNSNRHDVPPGLTGWAQVHGGKLVTADEKNALDEWYVRNANIWVDLRILRLTALAPFRGDRRRERVLASAIKAQAQAEASIAPPRPALAVVEPIERPARSSVGLASPSDHFERQRLRAAEVG